MSTSQIPAPIKQQLADTAALKNSELGMKYYSENPDEYEFLGYNKEEEQTVLFFRCPRSFSNLSIRVQNKKSASAS